MIDDEIQILKNQFHAGKEEGGGGGKKKKYVLSKVWACMFCIQISNKFILDLLICRARAMCGWEM